MSHDTVRRSVQPSLTGMNLKAQQQHRGQKIVRFTTARRFVDRRTATLIRELPHEFAASAASSGPAPRVILPSLRSKLETVWTPH
jgi:hypothetical protein